MVMDGDWPESPAVSLCDGVSNERTDLTGTYDNTAISGVKPNQRDELGAGDTPECSVDVWACVDLRSTGELEGLRNYPLNACSNQMHPLDCNCERKMEKNVKSSEESFRYTLFSQALSKPMNCINKNL